jgi:hypothetical protein
MTALDPQRLGPAIAVLIAWANSPSDIEFSSGVLLGYIEEDIPEADLVLSFLNLAAILLVQLEKATAIPAPKLMQDLARRYMS